MGKIDEALQSSRDVESARRRAHKETWPAVKEAARRVTEALRTEAVANSVTRSFKVALKTPFYQKRKPKGPVDRYGFRDHFPAEVTVSGSKSFSFCVQLYITGTWSGNPQPYTVGWRYIGPGQDDWAESSAPNDFCESIVAGFRAAVISHELRRQRP